MNMKRLASSLCVACAALLSLRAFAESPPTAVQTGTPRRVIAADDSTKTLASIGPDGRVEWKLPCGPIHDLHLLPNGHILYSEGWTRIVELDEHRKPIWDYNAKRNGNAGRTVEVHAFQRLPDGTTMIVESGPARIIEIDREGSVVREVPLTVKVRSAHSDTRNARKTAAGTYLVAHEKDGVVREYDAAGKVIWEFDVPLEKPAKGGHGPEAFGDQVYSAVRLADGNTLIGTGNGHSVLEVTPDKAIVWKVEQHDLPGITLAWVTQVERLANGNTRLINCHAGPDNPQIIEVTPEKQVVWTFKDFKTFGNSLPVAVVLDP
jgi:outer membrane protein assembly factor BamB